MSTKVSSSLRQLYSQFPKLYEETGGVCKRISPEEVKNMSNEELIQLSKTIEKACKPSTSIFADGYMEMAQMEYEGNRAAVDEEIKRRGLGAVERFKLLRSKISQEQLEIPFPEEEKPEEDRWEIKQRIWEQFDAQPKPKLIDGRFLVDFSSVYFHNYYVVVRDFETNEQKIASIKGLLHKNTTNPNDSAQALYIWLDSGEKCDRFLKGEVTRVKEGALEESKGENTLFTSY